MWEYKTITLKSGGFLGGKVDTSVLDAELNSYGREGWEVIAAFDTNISQGATRDVVVIMKRPSGN